MAQATTPKIEELRFRLKTDAKSRLFYPLAEELRKVGQFDEAEGVLRTGLEHHPTYLSAWVSLGRVLRDQKNEGGAAEALTKALQLDPGNVVAARLLADSYLAQGEKLEALKKYKLVHALMPADEELEGIIAQIDQELNPPPPAEPEPAAEEESPWATGDVEPMSVAHEESPFEDPEPSFTTAALEIEAPQGTHVEPQPAEVADVFAPAEEQPQEDITSTLTMADLYAGQGLTADARQIYETILHRDPNNETVRAKLAALDAPQAASGRNPKAVKLEEWLAKIGRREVSRV
jgi:tetratricopeptide (TPR) repeat protein